MNYIKKFEEVGLADIALVGGKNASLGQMISDLSAQGVRVPSGFATTSAGYWHFMQSNNLIEPVTHELATLTDIHDLENLARVGNAVRQLVAAGTIPADMQQEIIQSYHELSARYGVAAADVAVRSSATAEDLPTASFAGQQETFLNVVGDEALLRACVKSIASLFTDRAIMYRVENGFDHMKVALSIGVQKMVRSDAASSGVAFSLDTETGFKDVVVINATYGLGEMLVKGSIIPDEYVVHKPTLAHGYRSIIKKSVGTKHEKMIYQGNSVAVAPVSAHDQERYVLSDDQILEIARATVAIEAHYSQMKQQWTPMDVEWAQDGIDQHMYIVQSRPETIHSNDGVAPFYMQYSLQGSAPIIARGQSIGQQVVSGIARVVHDPKDIAQVQDGDILVADMTDPDWVPAMKKAAGIITNRGGRTCHAAIVSRELRTPAIVGTHNATEVITTGQAITIDCSQGAAGLIYDGIVPFTSKKIELTSLPKLAVDLMVNVADPDTAFSVCQLPVDGVGLARLEFIINNTVKIHPMALVKPDAVIDADVRKRIDTITAAYTDKKAYFVDTVAYGVGMIAAAFYPKPVIVRLSDFKTNEYRNLLGGSYFEPEEENPMIGFRGASRYYNDRYKDAFALECAALKKVREEMGLKNVQIMVPFVRTLAEGHAVLAEMAEHGLQSGVDELRIIMMCEIPSNVLLIDAFADMFDGFSIGSNDLTQLTLGVDRDSQILAPLFDERDPAVKRMMIMAIEGALRADTYIGICGQAPSDYPEIAAFLIEHGISSISLNPDSVVPFLLSR